MSQCSSRFFLVLLAGLLLFAGVTAKGDDVWIAAQSQGNVRYLSGGIGFAEREALSKAAAHERMNLKLIFAEPSGAFLSAVPVTITNASGVVLLKVRAEGPWLFVKLPAGEYHYRAERGGQVRSGTVNLSETERAQCVVSFLPK
jgi:hypothetical protein